MRETMARIGAAISEGVVRFRDAMRALIDDKSTAEDVEALMWLAAIGLVIVAVAWILRVHEKRRIM